jgi:hypothetical protein
MMETLFPQSGLSQDAFKVFGWMSSDAWPDNELVRFFSGVSFAGGCPHYSQLTSHLPVTVSTLREPSRQRMIYGTRERQNQ